MYVCVRLDNLTTKPRFQRRNLYILPRTKFQSSKYEKNITCNVTEDETNLVQTRLSGEFRASDVIIHKAQLAFYCSCHLLAIRRWYFLEFNLCKILVFTELVNNSLIVSNVVTLDGRNKMEKKKDTADGGFIRSQDHAELQHEIQLDEPH